MHIDQLRREIRAKLARAMGFKVIKSPYDEDMIMEAMTAPLEAVTVAAAKALGIETE